MRRPPRFMLAALSVGSALAQDGSQVISDETATLKLYGPGLFTTVGETGTVDIISGMGRPGYNVLLERWHALYPNVEIVIDAVPWDNWKAAIQTAALSGEYDILIHGNGNADFCEDMTPYLEADPEVKEALNFYPLRRNPDNMTEIMPCGLSYTASPMICAVDLDILAHYGVEPPTNEWTWADLAAIAQACTGTDPVPGQQTYGLSMVPVNNAQQNCIVLSRINDNILFDFAEKLADCKINFNTEKTVEVLIFWAELGQYVSADYGEMLDRALAFTEDNNLALIWNGEPATMYNTIVANGQEGRFMFVALPAIEEGEYKGLTASNMADLNISMYNKGTQKDWPGRS